MSDPTGLTGQRKVWNGMLIVGSYSVCRRRLFVAILCSSHSPFATHNLCLFNDVLMFNEVFILPYSSALRQLNQQSRGG